MSYFKVSFSIFKMSENLFILYLLLIQLHCGEIWGVWFQHTENFRDMLCSGTGVRKLFLKGQRVNSLGFVAHTVSSQLKQCKTAVDNT